MTDKDSEILIKIVPRLESLASNLWDTGLWTQGRKLDSLIKELEEVLKRDE